MSVSQERNEKGKRKEERGGSHALLPQQTQIAGYLHDDVSQKNPVEQKCLTENTKLLEHNKSSPLGFFLIACADQLAVHLQSKNKYDTCVIITNKADLQQQLVHL